MDLYQSRNEMEFKKAMENFYTKNLTLLSGGGIIQKGWFTTEEGNHIYIDGAGNAHYGSDAYSSYSKEGNYGVTGKDITGSWERRTDKFKSEIKDIVNAQGFDGLPQVVSTEEFDNAVKESGFIAQRTYSAEDQETLDSYRDMLYNGDWYIECDEGGSYYGQGMYCAADWSGNLTDGIKAEMERYKDKYLSKEHISYDEWLPHAINAVNSYGLDEKDCEKWIKGYYDKDFKTIYNGRVAMKEQYGEDKMMQIDFALSYKLPEKARQPSYTETITISPNAKVITYEQANKEFEEWKQKGNNVIKNIGSYCAAKGYDAINAEGKGKSGSYTVILNRTKTIIKKG